MRQLTTLLIVLVFFSCASPKQTQQEPADNVTRIVTELSADVMQGRESFTAGADKAAAFIRNEFKQIGLQPLPGEKDFWQSFSMTRYTPAEKKILLNEKPVNAENIVVITDKGQLHLTHTDSVEMIRIGEGENFFARFNETSKRKGASLITVHPTHAAAFKRVLDFHARGRLIENKDENRNAVYILTDEEVSAFSVDFSNKIETLSLQNVGGMIAGKSRPKEYVIFSGHYDHIGILPAVDGDSIANGADDDASGVTAVIELARHFKKQNNNERTLLFVAFTAEELGGFGSKYFSKKQNPDEVVAMFNIEMIGKDSKFGDNTAFITGYERSDFGAILQKNLEGTAFSFHPDPYPEQRLFYRSDNATLAALGVPAHTISTVQIDKDSLYHTVNDEVNSLNMNNISATIRAIALSATGIVAGKDTPRRIAKPEEQP